jgi:hypothetical protein
MWIVPHCSLVVVTSISEDYLVWYFLFLTCRFYYPSPIFTECGFIGLFFSLMQFVLSSWKYYTKEVGWYLIMFVTRCWFSVELTNEDILMKQSLSFIVYKVLMNRTLCDYSDINICYVVCSVSVVQMLVMYLINQCNPCFTLLCWHTHEDETIVPSWNVRN